MKLDLLGREINIGDTVVLYSAKSGNSRGTSPDFFMGKVVGFTAQMVVITQKRISRNLEDNLSDEGYGDKPIRKYPESLIVYSSANRSLNY